MGKAQSKRSVDITIEGKKGSSEEIEVTGKLEKIEDVDQKQQVNGDATPQETNDNEKKNIDESENDKDLTTEKSSDNAQTNGDNENQNTAVVDVVESSKKDDDKEIAPTKDGDVGEEISPLVDDSMKKSKKEKVKKKWSFRSISFGKKDKQKPTKTEENNGEPEKGAGDGVTEISKPEEDVAGDVETKTPTEKLENGDAVESELNGQNTPTPTKETPTEIINEEMNGTSAAPAEPAATNDVNTLTTNETAMDTQNEQKDIDVSGEVNKLSEGVVNNSADVVKNGTVDTPVEEDTDKTESKMIITFTADNCKVVSNVTNDQESDEKKGHQNGVTVEEEEEPVAEKIKSQIEVMINIDNNPAAILESSSTSTTFSDHPIVQNSNSDITNISNETASKVATVGCATIEAIEDVKIFEASSNEIVIPIPQKLKSDIIEVEAHFAANSVANENTDLTVSNQNELHSNMLFSPVAELAITDKCTPSSDGELVCETVETKTADQNEPPPPLPVSPPPSQVSVFAFKDNAEDMGKVNVDKELLPVIQQQFTSGSETNEIFAKADHNEMPNMEDSSCSVIEIKDETEITIPDQKNTISTNADINMMTTNRQEDNLILNENTRVVNAIADVITEKSIEIVKEKQNENNDNEQTKTKIDPEPVPIEITENVSEIVQYSPTVEEAPSSVTSDTIVVAVANGNDDGNKGIENISEMIFDNIHVDNQQIVDIVDVTLAHADNEQPERKELFSAFLNNDEYVSASKDVATDKENATAELTTQDLPVTCE